MQFSGTTEIKAPPERVFAFLIDPEQVGFCGPGVESIEVVDATHFKARAKVGVGHISARFAIDLELVEAEAPERAVIKAHGQAPGSAADATGTMNLMPGDESRHDGHGVGRRCRHLGAHRVRRCAAQVARPTS